MSLYVVIFTMSGDMETMFELIQSIETSMTTVCSIAGKLGAPRNIIINLNATKLSLAECKDLLLNFSQVITNQIDRLKTEIKIEPVIKINNKHSKNIELKSGKLDHKKELNMEVTNYIEHDQQGRKN